MTAFSHQVSFIPPPLTPAAILSFCPRADAYLLRLTRNSQALDNQERVERATRLLSTSVAGIDNVGASDADEHSLINHIFSTPSERFDDDWKRLRLSSHAVNPPADVSHGMSPFSPRLIAIISGSWEGRMEV
jgi:hypothetical protein